MLAKINNYKNFVINFYKIRKQNKNIQRQAKAAAYIYDEIIKGTPVEKIEKNIDKKVSKEIKSILINLKKIGYIKNLNLKPANSLSVVIPHYNHQKHLNQALESLKKQTVEPNEIIVVDDLSDNIELTKKTVCKYKNLLNIKLIVPEKKLYAGGCRQLGAESAKSSIISMHDADDISHPSRIELTKYFFKNHPDALHLNFGLVRFKNSFFDFLKKFEKDELDKNIIKTEEISKTMRQIFIEQRLSVLNQPETKIGCYGTNGNYFWGCGSGHVNYRKKVVDLVKWTGPKNYVFTKYEDYEFNLLLFLAAKKSFQVDLPLIYYRIGTSTNEVNY